jgi:hypothetical protein
VAAMNRGGQQEPGQPALHRLATVQLPLQEARNRVPPRASVHDDLVRRQSTAERPNQLWLTDITHRDWTVTIRKYVARARHLDDPVALGSLLPSATVLLNAAVRVGLNIRDAGSTQTGNPTSRQHTRREARRGLASGELPRWSSVTTWLLARSGGTCCKPRRMRRGSLWTSTTVRGTSGN